MKLIILNGPAGVGKSTISARLVADLPDTVLMDIDELRRTIPNYKENRQESLLQAYQQMLEIAEANLIEGKDVLIDKAISYADTLDALVEVGRKCGAEVYEILLFADKETVLARADERGYKPGSLLTREKVGELWEKADAIRKERSNAVVIDTKGKSIDEVVAQIKEVVHASVT